MKIDVLKGDITTLEVDAIVNAANSSLLGGGGVDGAIHKAGGKQILEECMHIRNQQGGCKVGEAVITNAGKLKAKKVIHTVGPKWSGGNAGESEKLRTCYQNSLRLAEQADLQSIAFPNISTGVYGYPKTGAAEVALKAVKDYPYEKVQHVIFVCFDDENYRLYSNRLNDPQ
ncbi:O-acetyl-ADP-ribose deacetylase [Pareuzebyella sediminis]|uniref:O-acetyl-ADP-ribose deacetylase n=1 Tax=Pareuzebyella sediminis TaxID=2607998 RepID=UPI0011ECDA3B|nr:O-acetyl-ADP-ribose deacetylase [Pareuzebyella sediminis]